MWSIIRSFAVGLVAISTATGAAVAEDHNSGTDHSRARYKVDWSGLYVGGHVAYAWSGADAQLLGPDELLTGLDFIGAPTSSSVDLNDWVGGGHLGLQRQFGNWVFGAEASFRSGLSGSAVLNFQENFFEVPVTGQSTLDLKIKSLYTVTAKAGYAWQDWFAYVKAGYASGDVRAQGGVTAYGSFSSDEGSATVDANGSNNSSKRHHGWTAGAGLSRMVYPNLVLGLEYDYISLQSELHQGPGSLSIGYDNITIEEVTAQTTSRIDPDAIHSINFRLSYLFNGLSGN
jgi:outer membrane immunogenic protein